MFDFDADKNSGNKKKHGVFLEEAEELWNVDHIIIPAKNISDEERYLILGKFKKKVYIGKI